MQILSSGYGYVFGGSVAALEYEGEMSRNQFDGTCYKCGLPVKAGTGHFERIPFKKRGPGEPKWRTQHAYYSEHGGVTCEMAKSKPSATVIDLPVCEVDVMVGSGGHRI